MSGDNKPLSIKNTPLAREIYEVFGRSSPEHRCCGGQFSEIERLKRATSVTIYGNGFSRWFVASDSGKMGIIDTENGLVVNVIIITRNGHVKQILYNRIHDKNVPVPLSPRKIRDYGEYIRSIGGAVLPIAARLIKAKAVDHYDDADPARPGNLSEGQTNAVRAVNNWFSNLNGEQPPLSPGG